MKNKIQTDPLKMKTILCEMKYICGWVNGRLDVAKEKISELKDTLVLTIQNTEGKD
jgi:hypothetical protein